MRVQILTKASFPDGFAATNKINCLCKAMIAKGIDTRVFSLHNNTQLDGSVCFNEGLRDKIPYKILLNRKISNGLLNLIWIQIAPFILIINSVWRIRKVDIFFLYLDRTIPQLLLIFFAKLFGKKVVYESVEYPYATDGDKFTRIPFINKALVWINLNLIFPHINGFDVISENMIDVIKKHSNPKSEIKKTPILTDVNDWDFQLVNTDIDEPYLFHAGALSEQKDGIVSFFEAYAQAHLAMRSHGIFLKLVVTNMKTQPSTLYKLNSIIETNNLREHIIVTGYLEKDELIAYLNGASVLLYNKPNTFQNQYNFPIKMAEYLLADAPVVVAAKGIELNNYLENNVNSLVVEPDDVGAMANAVLKLLFDKELSSKINLNGRETARESFDFRKHEDGLFQFFDKVMRN